MTRATYKSVCLACGKQVVEGDALERSEQLPGAPWTHEACRRAAAAPEFSARLGRVWGLHATKLRAVAKAMGCPVTRDGRYVDGSEVQHLVCSHPDATKFENALALATGKASAPAAPAAAVDPALLAKMVKAAIDAEFQFGADREVRVSVEAAVAAAKAEVESLARAAALAAVAAAKAEVESLARAAALAAVPVVHRFEVARGGEVAHSGAGRPHRSFGRLLKMVAADCCVWLAGPAGSGKTTAARMAAEALGLKFYFNGAIDTEYKLSGFVDAHGRVVSTAFRRAYTEGGLYLFDEVDASLPGATLAFNAALAGDLCDFPGDAEPTRKHKDFRCVAAGNTWGYGATAEYVGRNKMDAAFLDRFVQLTWDYDEDLEAALAGDAEWCRTVQRLRRRARERGLKVVVSPRATIFGGRLIAAGMTRDEALEACVFAKMTKQDRDNLQGA